MRHWVAMVDRRDGRRDEKVELVTPREHNELIRLRRENIKRLASTAFR